MPVSEQEVPCWWWGQPCRADHGGAAGVAWRPAHADRAPQGHGNPPRAASFHQRTMEIFRSVGLQQAVEAAASGSSCRTVHHFVDALSGKELACFYRTFNDGVEGLSPTSRLFITQIGLEPLLRERARELGADLTYATEIVSFEQDDAGVVAVLRPRDGGQERRVRARYLIGADGATACAQQLGISMAAAAALPTARPSTSRRPARADRRP